MATLHAYVLPVLALVALGYIYLHASSTIVHAVATYAAFAVIFGCVHFVIYRHSPILYVVSKDIPNAATVDALSGGQKRFDRLLDEIAFTDVVLVRVSEREPKDDPRLAVAISPRSYAGVVPGLELTTETRMSLVGPRRDIPVYSINVDVRMTSSFRGVNAGARGVYRLASPDSDSPDATFPLSELTRLLRDHRRTLVSSLTDVYEKDSMRPALFGLSDFFYFAFSMTGVGEVIPVRTEVRLLVLLQFLLSVVLPVALAVKKPSLGLAK